MVKFQRLGYCFVLWEIYTMYIMTIKKTKILSILLLLSLFLNLTPSSVFSQFEYPVGKLQTEVSARIGEFYLNVSGFISPYASIVLTTQDGTFLRSTVADKNGNFYISFVLIKEGFSGFCLTAVDFQRLGESTTCFSFPPATGSITMRDIFLPPTLGLSKTEIAAGSSVFAFGFTMPFAKVTLRLSDGTILTTTADSRGYYEFQLKDLKAGKYQLYAKAQYKDKESLTPTKKLELKALSWWEQFLAFLKNLWKQIVRFFSSFALGPLWLVIPVIILIIILILKLWPQWFTSIYESKPFSFLKRFKKKKLHHWWWMGY